jgi:hypothetical protein
LARVLERRHPELIVSDMKKALRTGKIFVDWSQNDDHKTTICVYSLRARERPTVSTPVTWEEVEKCLKKGDPKLLVFDSDRVLERVVAHGDLFAPVVKLKQKLPPLAALAEGGGVIAKTSAATKTTVSADAAPPAAKKRRAGAAKPAKAAKKSLTKTAAKQGKTARKVATARRHA